MKSFTPFSLGAPGSFGVSGEQENYWQERIAYEMSYSLYMLQDGAFSFQQEEEADYTALMADADSAVETFSDWLAAAVNAQTQGADVPAIPDAPGVPSTISPASIVIFIGKIALQFGLKWLWKKFDKSSDTGELVALLDKALMAEEDGEKISILKKGLLSESTDEQFISNLWLLANQPIEIMLNRSGSIEAVNFNSINP